MNAMVDSRPRGPLGERVRALEEGRESSANDIARIERAIGDLTTSMGRVEKALAERRGVDRVSAFLMHVVVSVVSGSIGATLGHLWH